MRDIQLDINEEQRAKLLSIFQILKVTVGDVCDAYETELMVDAKDSVRGLCETVRLDNILEPDIKNQIMEYLNDAGLAISTFGGNSTYQRAGRCLEHLGKAESYIQAIMESNI